MNNQQQLMQKMRAQVAGLPTAQVIEAFELTEANQDPEIPTVRGVLMDELEKRDPAAFEQWLESVQASPRQFFQAA